MRRACRASPGTKDTAFLVKAGSTFLLQVHYTTNGKEAIDKSVVGLKIRKDKPTYRAVCGSATQFRLDIPPGDPSYETKATYTFREDTTLLDLTPHMHLRGKAFKYVLTYPDGRSEVLLDVPHYDFNWQLAYILAEPRTVPRGIEDGRNRLVTTIRRITSTIPIRPRRCIGAIKRSRK